MRAKALYANKADTDEELTFNVGDILVVHQQDVAGLIGWWLCSIDDRVGIAPGNRLRLLTTGAELGKSSPPAAPSPTAALQDGARKTLAGAADNKLNIPRKSGNVYVYDHPASHVVPQVDYDIPLRHLSRPSHHQNQQPTAAPSQPDYDVPHHGGGGGGCATDYDVPVCYTAAVRTPSNRSSVVSILSTGSQSSLTSGREHQTTSLGPPVDRIPSVRDSVLDDYDVPRSDVASDGSNSADSGVYCGVGLGGVRWPTTGVADAGSSIKVKRPTTSTMAVTTNVQPSNECPDYDEPSMYVIATSETAPRIGNQQEQQMNGKTNTKEDDDGSSLAALKDKALANVDRLVRWLSNDQTSNRHQWSVQVKMAGLALKTSLQDLADVGSDVRQLSQSSSSSSEQELRKSLGAFERLLDCVIAAPSSTSSSRTAITEKLDAIRKLTSSLPVIVRQFADDVSEQYDQGAFSKIETESRPSQLSTERICVPPRDNHGKSAPVVLSNSPTSSSPRPENCHGKPPPVKPKPPKHLIVDLRRRNNNDGSNDNNNGASQPETHQIKIAAPDDGGWSADDCDYAAIASEAESQLQMDSVAIQTAKQSETFSAMTANRPPRPPVAAKPPVAKKPVVSAATQSRQTSQTATTQVLQVAAQPGLIEADRELVEFYASQIAAHSSLVETAARDFFRHAKPDNRLQRPAADVFVRRSRFVVLAGHKLVYLGDSLARHVADGQVRDRVAVAANELCDRLKAVVMATKVAALIESEESISSMADCVALATHSCLQLCDVIGQISLW